MSKKHKILDVKVGDTVQIGPDRLASFVGQFEAEVMQLSRNHAGNTIMTFRRLQGETEKFSLCNVSLVKRVIKSAPSVYKGPVNVFAQSKLPYFAFFKGGTCRGTLEDLVSHALSKVTNYNLERPLDWGRCEVLYEKAQWPGMVKSLEKHQNVVFWDDIIVVRWKTFSRWAQRNAGRLIQTKAEAEALELAHKAGWDRSLKDTLEADMLHMMEEDLNKALGEMPLLSQEAGEDFDQVYS